MNLMKRHPTIVPFMIYIANEDKHLERFAVRAKYMTLDPARNKYAKYIKNIRAIQEYLCKRADKHLVPKVHTPPQKVQPVQQVQKVQKVQQVQKVQIVQKVQKVQ